LKKLIEFDIIPPMEVRVARPTQKGYSEVLVGQAIPVTTEPDRDPHADPHRQSWLHVEPRGAAVVRTVGLSGMGPITERVLATRAELLGADLRTVPPAGKTNSYRIF